VKADSRALGLATLIATVDRMDSPFERGLGQLSLGFSTVEMAISDAGRGKLALDQLAGALTLGKTRLAAVLPMLAPRPDEQGLEAYVEAELWLIDRIEEHLQGQNPRAAAIREIHETFVEHQPMNWIAIAGTLGGAREIRELLDGISKGVIISHATRAALGEARLSLEMARRHVTSGDSLGSRFESYLETYERFAAELTLLLPASKGPR
jgi:hypothetical protein